MLRNISLAIFLLAPTLVRSAPGAVFHSLSVGKHRISFETASGEEQLFSGVQKILGGQEGEETGAPAICYTLSGNGPRTQLAFFADDMGGDALRSFELSQTRDKQFRITTCSPLQVAPAEVVTDRGIRLGLSRRAVEKILGPAESKKDGFVIYSGAEAWEHKGNDGTTEPYELISELRIRYLGDRIVSISAGLSNSKDTD
jgi:hypothetical protein